MTTDQKCAIMGLSWWQCRIKGIRFQSHRPTAKIQFYRLEKLLLKSHRPTDWPVTPWQPPVARKKYAFPNWLLWMEVTDLSTNTGRLLSELQWNCEKCGTNQKWKDCPFKVKATSRSHWQWMEECTFFPSKQFLYQVQYVGQLMSNVRMTSREKPQYKSDDIW